MSHTTRLFDAFFFDMDGTILSSLAAAERCWTAWAQRHGVDIQTFLPTMHGMRALDTIKRLQLPHIDPQVEADALTLAEIADVADIEAIAGAKAFLASLPPQRWAVVTSAPRLLALRRMEAAGLPVPALLISAEDVLNGKPAPDGFLLAAKRLGVAIERCLVFEDAPAGIQAAEAAGANVLVVTAMHRQPLISVHPMLVDYQAIRAVPTAAGIELVWQS